MLARKRPGIEGKFILFLLDHRFVESLVLADNCVVNTRRGVKDVIVDNWHRLSRRGYLRRLLSFVHVTHVYVVCCCCCCCCCSVTDFEMTRNTGIKFDLNIVTEFQQFY